MRFCSQVAEGCAGSSLLAVYVSSVWYLLNTSCCPWSGKHASVINLPDTSLHIHKSGKTCTYLDTDIHRNTHMHTTLYWPYYKPAINSTRKLKRDYHKHGTHQRWSSRDKTWKAVFSGCTDAKRSVQLVFIAEMIKPRKRTLLRMMVCCAPSWPQSLSHVSLPILEPFMLGRVFQTPPPPHPPASLEAGCSQTPTLAPVPSRPVDVFWCASAYMCVCVCVGSSVRRCSHSPAETDRWNHFTRRQKGRIQETGVCLIVLALLRLVLI